MVIKTAIFFLLAFMLQADALPATIQDISVAKAISQKLDVFNIEKLIRFIGEHSEILEELIPSVASTIYELATRKTETKAALLLPHIDDVMACINITINVYDIEIFLYHTYQFSLEVYDSGLDLGADIRECRKESSNVFDIIECAIDIVENSSLMFQAFFNRTSELVLELENSYYALTGNIMKCVGYY